MPSLYLTVLSGKKNVRGEYAIRFAINHKRETCYIVTRFHISSLSQFRSGRVVKRPDASVINAKLSNLLDIYQNRLDGIISPDLYTCKQLKTMIQSAGNAMYATFQSVTDEFISQLESEGRNSYAKMIEHNSRTFIEYCKGDIPMQGVTPELIDGYVRYLKRKGTISDTSVNIMLARTKMIVNRAIRQRLVTYEVHPFVACKISSSPIREADLSVESVRRIMNSTVVEKRLRVARDLFILSFYLGGINMIDLMSIDFRKDKIEYVRTKSKNTTQGTRKVCFSMPAQAKAVAAPWINRNTGKLNFGYKYTYENFARYMSRSLHKLGDELGISERLIFYSARKTFAQFASEIGIPDSVIDYCLGHSDRSRGVIRYYTKIRQKQADIAISRVIDYVNDPDKYKDLIEMRQDFMMHI